MSRNDVTRTHKVGRRLKRRELLSWGLIAASTALAAQSCATVLYFARPVAVAGEFGGKFDLGPVTELPDVDAPPIDHRRGRFLLVRTAAGIIALHKVCTHLGCLLTWDEEVGAFVCPCHGSQFDREGKLLSGPATRDLDRFVVQLITSDGQVVAATDPRRGEPVAVPAASSAETPTDETTPTPTSASADEEQDPAAEPMLRVIVDTGRLIRR